jgi:hypothetical protein
VHTLAYCAGILEQKLLPLRLGPLWFFPPTPPPRFYTSWLRPLYPSDLAMLHPPSEAAPYFAASFWATLHPTELHLTLNELPGKPKKILSPVYLSFADPSNEINDLQRNPAKYPTLETNPPKYSTAYCQLIVLPTGWLFGCINKRGRVKSGEAGQICGRILAVLYRKGQQGGQTSDNFAFLLLLSIKIGKPRKYFTFPTDKLRV